ncbi:methyl-accepting chemotaxis protein [Salinibius halmophilus]|uniref:methyl-accepting chemotaxis protein n=1 Tax=Salinibius halmophilus TaxID=1853216 RepID=UPI000E66BEE9|nr:methyl-accepting chemotaxis protein [Salinibius halmophilus]
MLKSLKLRIYLLVFVPFLLITIVSLIVESRLVSALQEATAKIVETSVIDVEKHRLKSVMQTAETAIQPLIDLPGTTGKDEGLAQLALMKFDGDVGYMSAYDSKGTRLMHAGGAGGIGDNYWNLKDTQGNLLIQGIIQSAKEGDGYYTYYFPKPGESVAEPKFGYYIYIDKWDVIVGTGFYIDSVEQTLAQVDSEISTQAAQISTQTIALLLVLAALIFVASFFGIRSVYDPLQRLKQAVGNLASGAGDLTAKLPKNNISLLNDTSQYFNKYLDSLAVDIKQLKESTRELESISSTSSQQGSQLKAVSQQQMHATTQVAAAIEQLASTANQIAESAETTRATAGEAETGIHSVLGQVKQGRHELESLNDILSSMENSVQALEQNVGTINDSLNVISSISEQTNLLALNAAIEAARAGDQGRGFAVVADEVRSLAQRSKESTEDIQQVLEKLQSSMQRTVSDMAGSADKRQAVTEAMASISEIVNQSTQLIRQLAEQNVQVATAAHEQAQVAADVAKNVTGIADLSSEVDGISQQNEEQIQSIEKQSNQIASITSKFTV